MSRDQEEGSITSLHFRKTFEPNQSNWEGNDILTIFDIKILEAYRWNTWSRK